ncbi:MAG: hypothetical protein GY913_24820 [Proteobacteria bacterium]|nr:hypothetical protein [Pseudomonadota bacterium]MCP4920138.1 hypothetical protein [Pseudomonadota bacterium]
MWLFLLACEPPPEPAQEPAAAVEIVEAAPRVDPSEVAIRHVLISHKDATKPGIRSRAEAEDFANSLRERVLAGEDFRVLAAKYSNDSGTAPRGGWLGTGDKGTWVPAFEAAAFALEVGEISQAVETPFGFHVLLREDHTGVVLKHLVVRHEASVRSRLATPSDRTLAEAHERASEARERIEAGESFDDVAKEMSDGPYAGTGGDLGEFMVGELGEGVDEVVAVTGPGELSQVFETPHGAHIILRVE